MTRLMAVNIGSIKKDKIASVPKHAAATIQALNSSQILVLVFSNGANKSNHGIREAEVAVNREIPIIPFRIENVLPTQSMEYLLCTSQWLDAVTPPLEMHLPKLAETAQSLLANRRKEKIS